MAILIRDEIASDCAAIHAVVGEAFGRADEADLIASLRRNGDLVISLVAEAGGNVVGHIALSRLLSPQRSLALAPLAVVPTRQRAGIGAALVRAAIERARQAGEAIVFVLGDPAYYQRFGFRTETAEPFPSPYAGPYFMALTLASDAPPAAPVIYAAAFDELS